MPTATVRLFNNSLVYHTRALLDSGSQHTLITTECASSLALQIFPVDMQLQTISSSDTVQVRGFVHINLSQHVDPPFLHIKAYVIDKLIDPIPAFGFRPEWPELTNLDLADPSFNQPQAVSLLLGSDVIPFLLLPNFKQPTADSPGALSTTLGWVLFGPYVPRRVKKHVTFSTDTCFTNIRNANIAQVPLKHSLENAQSHSVPLSNSSPALPCTNPPLVSHIPDAVESTNSTLVFADSIKGSPLNSALISTFNSQADDNDLNTLVRQFWELDRVPDTIPLTPAETKCENMYASSVARTSMGRYIVKMPFTSCNLGVSKNSAIRQFARLEQRLRRSPELRKAYHEFMQDYLDSGHMELVSSPSDGQSYEPYYIPHHPVHRPDDPASKIRVVFNASCATSNGRSLNDLLLTGPKLQADISTLLSRFRLHKYAFTADIRQMYRQILIHPEHRDYQRIVWRFSEENAVQSYRLNTVTYGVSSAPYLALRTLQQLSVDEGENFPIAKHVLQEEVYVDDILTGSSTIKQALQHRKHIQDLLLAGGFELRKWASNHPSLLAGIPSDHYRVLTPVQPMLIDRDPALKILGLGWNPSSDHFFYDVRLSESVITKRTVLSQTARIFDPLGWLSPVTFSAKIFFRRLCLLGIEWDQNLPPDEVPHWTSFQSQLPSLATLQIPRFIPDTSSSAIMYLVGFCDASESGYAAVVTSSLAYHLSPLKSLS